MENEFAVLYETVMDRKLNPEEGSYTSYLYSKGEEKILKKGWRRMYGSDHCLIITIQRRSGQ